MGSAPSKPRQQPKGRQEPATTKQNVLLSPVFAVPASTVGSSSNNNDCYSHYFDSSSLLLPPAVYHRIVLRQQPLSYLAVLHQTDPAMRLIQDFMQPGLDICAAAAAGTSVRASVHNKSTTNGDSRLQTRFLIDRRHNLVAATDIDSSSSSSSLPQQQFQLLAGTDRLPTLSTRLVLPLPSPSWLCLSLAADAQGKGWVGAHLAHTWSIAKQQRSSSSTSLHQNKQTEYYRNDPFVDDDQKDTSSSAPDDLDLNLHLGSWLTVDAKGYSNNNKTITAENPLVGLHHPHRPILRSIHGYAVAHVLGATAAVEACLPLVRQRRHDNSTAATTTMMMDYGAFETKSHFSLNLTDDNNESSSNTNNPPLWLCLERNGTQSAMSLSQTLHFDRYQLNPYEDRADHVRNSLAWAIRLERHINDDTTTTTANERMNHEAMAGHSGSNAGMDVCMAAVWQLNRSVALKAVVRPSRQQLDTALLLKRWKQPAVTCSILHRYSWRQLPTSSGSGGTWQFLGVGLELETGRSPQQPLTRDDNLYPMGAAHLVGRTASNNNKDEDVPPTITTSKE